MRDNTRLLATLVIWSAFTIIMGIIAAVVATGDELDWVGAVFLLIILLTLMVIVGTSTQAIWGAKQDDSADDEERRLAKAKRIGSRRVERLIEQLDDDEIYDLEALLLAREDGTTRRRQP
jgi:4-hydroxybenzoate polyprenyltransferase